MNDSKISQILNSQVFLYSFGILIFIYIFLRSWHLGFTFDEVTSFQIARESNWFAFWEHSNNHVLNTALILPFVKNFMIEEWQLRLPNVLSFLIYIIAVIKVLGTFRKEIRWSGLLMFSCMPFLIDFFGLCRGYGLSMSCMMLSIMYLVIFIQRGTLLHLSGALIVGAFSTLANLTLFNFFLPLIFTLLAFILLDEKTRFIKLKRLLLLFGITGLFFALMLPKLFILRDANMLYFGGQRGIYHDIVRTLGRCFAYHKMNVTLGEVIFILLFGFSALFSGWNLFGAFRTRKLDLKSSFSLLFLLSIAAPLSQHLIFGTNFPSERTALLYYPLMVLVWISGVEIIKPQVHLLGLKLVGILFLGQFIYSANLSYTYSWKYNAHDEKMASFIRIENAKSNENLKVGVGILHRQTLEYYRELHRNFDPQITVYDDFWKFGLSIEELQPYYYGASHRSKPHLTNEDVQELYALDLDLFHFDQYYVDELNSHGASFKILESFEDPPSHMVELLND